mgnify:CR=1 FL=1
MAGRWTAARADDDDAASEDADAPKCTPPEPEPRSIAADTVVLATGLVPNPAVAEGLRSSGLPVVEIGDVTGVGYIEGAIRGAARAAAEIAAL